VTHGAGPTPLIYWSATWSAGRARIAPGHGADHCARRTRLSNATVCPKSSQPRRHARPFDGRRGHGVLLRQGIDAFTSLTAYWMPASEGLSGLPPPLEQTLMVVMRYRNG
jgi:hypothetical protein